MFTAAKRLRDRTIRGAPPACRPAGVQILQTRSAIAEPSLEIATSDWNYVELVKQEILGIFTRMFGILLRVYYKIIGTV
jgi:hypothetical protein